MSFLSDPWACCPTCWIASSLGFGDWAGAPLWAWIQPPWSWAPLEICSAVFLWERLWVGGRAQAQPEPSQQRVVAQGRVSLCVPLSPHGVGSVRDPDGKLTWDLGLFLAFGGRLMCEFSSWAMMVPKIACLF